MNTMTPKQWAADRRVRWRVIVIGIFLGCLGWLVEGQHTPVPEAIGTVVLLGASVSWIAERVVDRSRTPLGWLVPAIAPAAVNYPLPHRRY